MIILKNLCTLIIQIALKLIPQTPTKTIEASFYKFRQLFIV